MQTTKRNYILRGLRFRGFGSACSCWLNERACIIFVHAPLESGFRVLGLGFRVLGLGSGFRV